MENKEMPDLTVEERNDLLIFSALVFQELEATSETGIEKPERAKCFYCRIMDVDVKEFILKEIRKAISEVCPKYKYAPLPDIAFCISCGELLVDNVIEDPYPCVFCRMVRCSGLEYIQIEIRAPRNYFCNIGVRHCPFCGGKL